MIEKEIALKLLKPTIELEKQNVQTFVPKTLFKNIEKCNFNLLQQECNKLGFYICKADQTPFDKRYYKSQFKKGVLYVTYTNNSVNNVTNN